jgi:hypothetical protein
LSFCKISASIDLGFLLDFLGFLDFFLGIY